MNTLIKFLGAAQFMDTFVGSKDRKITDKLPNGSEAKVAEAACANGEKNKKNI